MKVGKALLVAFILMAFPTVGFGQKETASKDANGVRGLLLHDAANLQTRRWLDDGNGGALVSFGAGGVGVVDQGISGTSDADPWNVMIRSGAGTELGLAASPFAISIFDAASNLLGVTANPLVIDMGLNNDIQGDVADDAPDTGNPLKEGGVARTGLRTPVADGDRVDASYDKEGRKVTAPHGVRENEVRNEITLTTTTETEVLAAGGAGVFLDVTGILVSNTSNTTLRVLLRDVLSGTVVISPPAASGGGGSAPLMLVPIPQATANSQWTAELSSMPTGGNVKVFLQAVKRQ